MNEFRTFSSGATKNVSKGKGRYDLIPFEALSALAKRFEYGVELGHEENGYRKGIPNNVLFDSAFRHLSQAMSGMTDEDHLAAVMWNVSVLLYNRDHFQPITEPNVDLDMLYNRGDNNDKDS